MEINVRFCRLMLSALIEEFAAEHKDIRVVRHAWVLKVDKRNHWEFHVSAGPAKGYFWYGHADNAYDARYHGWMAWARTQGDD